MSFKYFNAPTTAVYSNEEEKLLVTALSDLGIQKLFQVHNSQEKVSSAHNKMFAGMTPTENYNEDCETVLKSVVAYAAKSAGLATDDETLKSLAHRKNTVFSEKFFGIVDQALPPVITATVNYAFMNVADVKNIGWGDTAHFTVPSKDIFTVNGLGLGTKHGAIQRVYSEDITVNPVNKEVTVALDWYQMVTGRYDIGDFMYRVGLSYATDISKLVYSQIDGAYASLPTPLKVAGFDDTKFISIAQRVKAANGNLPVYAMGTMIALQSVLPSNDWLKVELGDEFSTIGFLSRYKGVNLLEVPQVLVPGTVNTTLDFGIDDTRIYFFATGDRPVKIVFEGQVITSQTDVTESADGQMVITVKQKYDAKLASASVIGIIDLNA